MKRKFIYLAIASMAICTGAYAQADGPTASHTIGVTIPPLAIIDIESAVSPNLTFTFTSPTEAGNPITAPQSDNSLWLNYSAINAASTSKKISVKLSALIPGIDIKLLAAAASGSSGGGTLGTPVAEFTLSATDQPLINSIGSSYTGDGASNGHQLTYKISSTQANYQNYVAASVGSATVTYTISDQ